MTDMDPRDVARLLALCLEPKLLDQDHPVDDLLNAVHDDSRIVDHFGMTGNWRDRHYELTPVGRKVIFDLLEDFRPDNRFDPPVPETTTELHKRLAAAERLVGALWHYVDCAMRNQYSTATANAQAEARRARVAWENTILIPELKDPAPIMALGVARERGHNVGEYVWSLRLGHDVVATATCPGSMPTEACMTVLVRSLIEGRPT